MELIDKKALIDKCLGWNGNVVTCDAGTDFCESHATCIECIINTMPLIEAAPVVRGEWIEDDGRVRVCSICGTDWCHKDEMDFEQYFNFCPNCGAKMDEV